MTQEYNNGWVAFFDGEPITSNPHEKGSTFWMDWNQGWKDAQGMTAL